MQTPLSEYVVATAGFAILGIWLFLVFRWWHGHLRRLAELHSVEQRRRIAARHYLAVLLVVGGPMLGVVLSVIRFTRVSGLFLVVAFALLIAPAGVWFAQRIASLKALGYGRHS